jgi:hypothetical protein
MDRAGQIRCIGIYKCWETSLRKHGKKHLYGSRGGKQHLNAYFIDSNEKITRIRISKFEAIRLKLGGIWKRRRFFCLNCEQKYTGLILYDKDVPNCPYCGA